ncbi:cytochrome c oxidase subunit 3 family protein [Mycolicibacterium anyangense]|jgi:nitric oxide reductase NorE protein|nr:cytochrome c oxidase subunit 3 family protein [Mycolicibacterium anyangense]
MTSSTMRESARADRPVRYRVPGEPGIWFVIFGDLLAFGALFITYMYYRGRFPEAFADGLAAMSRGIGVVNTVVLLSASLAVVQGVGAYRAGDRRAADRALIVAFGCGAGFVVLKSVEYGIKISQSLVPNTSAFFGLYYTFTGVHLVHVVIGLALLLYLRAVVRRPTPDIRDRQVVESGAVFWHLVDLLWVVLFALFYAVHV